ncbi:hypothetical protein N781_05790 [Pontibacillus halophilus JSM 076056 = DSM 19796]|uniref:Type II secretion system protein GspF domain-containing protein n=1 Tax=Pontibacillus halophilus JSM 076056 = DSM 19796 TaxID=1385510 RepID=A0A0A5GG35_9BACI|nr:competence type IV pilus assembly protein ComGB [Pontibacillus halophilus]KGX90959.1 hypothetical protein N781_05790 [Pontibacillus halophilus JSM 076056 = DSM 19796]
MRLAILKRHKSPPLAHQIYVLNRIGLLLKKGYSFLKTIEFLLLDKKARHDASVIQEKLREGKRLDEIFRDLSYSKSVTLFMYFAPAQGNVHEVFQHCVQLLHMQDTYQGKLRKTLQYPAILFSFASLMMAYLRFFLLPSFLTLYDSLHYSSRFITHLLRAINGFLLGSFVLMIAIVILWIVWKFIMHHFPIGKQVEWMERIPLMNTYVSSQLTYLFAYHYSALSRTGLSAQRTLAVMERQPHYPALKHYTYQILQQLENGVRLPIALTSCALLHPTLSEVFSRNEQDGQLDEDLETYAELIMTQLEGSIVKGMTFIQPIFMIMCGASIISIYLAIMMPLFQWMNNF